MPLRTTQLSNLGFEVDSREPSASFTHRVTDQELARILKTSVDALLEAKDETIADLRDRVAFLERQLESRVEEIRRRDHIIAALTERIPPAIEAADREKPPRARESAVEEPTRDPRWELLRRAHTVPGGTACSGNSPALLGAAQGAGSPPEYQGCARPWIRASGNIPRPTLRE